MPIVPQPNASNLKKDFINCNNGFYIIDQKLLEIFSVLKQTCNYLKIDFNSKQGMQIDYRKAKLKSEEQKRAHQIEILQSEKVDRIYEQMSFFKIPTRRRPLVC